MDLKAADKATLEDALASLGLKVHHIANSMVIQTPAGNISVKDGKAEFINKECQTWVNKIKQAYSFKTVERISKRFKFNMTVKGDNKVVLRRY